LEEEKAFRRPKDRRKSTSSTKKGKVRCYLKRRTRGGGYQHEGGNKRGSGSGEVKKVLRTFGGGIVTHSSESRRIQRTPPFLGGGKKEGGLFGKRESRRGEEGGLSIENGVYCGRKSGKERIRAAYEKRPAQAELGESRLQRKREAACQRETVGPSGKWGGGQVRNCARERRHVIGG